MEKIARCLRVDRRVVGTYDGGQWSVVGAVQKFNSPEPVEGNILILPIHTTVCMGWFGPPSCLIHIAREHNFRSRCIHWLINPTRDKKRKEAYSP